MEPGNRMLGKRMLLTALLTAMLSASPASELRAALSDLQNVPPAERPFQRYLSGYHVKDPARVGRVISFWVNSLSNARRISPVTKVSDTLYRLDIRNYQWAKEAWEKLQKKEPYFRFPWSGELETQSLFQETGSGGAIFRADWFLFQTSIDPFYSEFLGLPGTLAEIKAKFRVDETGARALALPHGGVVLNSEVALNNRRLERLPGLTGYWWQSYDFVANHGERNLIENLLEIKPDGGESIWSLPNGLQAYLVTNKDGKRLAEVPPNIAQDRRTPFRNKSVVTARSCVGCHSGGINPFSDVVRNMLLTGSIDAKSYDFNRAIAVDDFYRGEVTTKQIAVDCTTYGEAVAASCGMAPAEISAAFTGQVYDYAERPVTLMAAAGEVGCSVDQLTAAIHAMKPAPPTLVVLSQGQPVARDAWEASYPVAAVAVRGRK